MGDQRQSSASWVTQFCIGRRPGTWRRRTSRCATGTSPVRDEQDSRQVWSAAPLLASTRLEQWRDVVVSSGLAGLAPLRPALSGSPGGFGTNTLAGGKQGVRLVPTWTVLQHRGSGAAVDADTLAIGDEAVADQVPSGAAAARPCGVQRATGSTTLPRTPGDSVHAYWGLRDRSDAEHRRCNRDRRTGWCPDRPAPASDGLQPATRCGQRLRYRAIPRLVLGAGPSRGCGRAGARDRAR